MYPQGPGQPAPGMPAAPDDDQELDLDQFEERVGRAFGIPRGLREALKGQESGGRDSAVSPKGARGKFQVMPDTVRKYGLDPNNEFDRVYSGLKYLKEKYDSIDPKISDPVARWQGALAGYHGGEAQINNINRTGGEIRPTSDGLTTTDKYTDSVMRKWQQLSKGGGKQPLSPPPSVSQPQPQGPKGPQPKPTLPLDAVKRGLQPRAPQAPASPGVSPSEDFVNRFFGSVGKGIAAIPEQGAAFADFLAPYMAQSAGPGATPYSVRDIQNYEQAGLRPAVPKGIPDQLAPLNSVIDDVMSPAPTPERQAAARQTAQALQQQRVQQALTDRSAPKIRQQFTTPAEQAIERQFPVDPNITASNDFWRKQLPEGAGSMGAFLAAGFAGRVLGAPKAMTAMYGALQNAQQAIREYDQSGKNSEKGRQATYAFAALVGSLEALGLGKTIEKFGGKAKFIERLLETGEEGLQEYVSNVLNDFNAGYIGAYDPSRAKGFETLSSKENLQAGGLGLILGGGGQIASATAERLGGRPQVPGVAAQPQGPRPGPPGQPAAQDIRINRPTSPIQTQRVNLANEQAKLTKAARAQGTPAERAAAVQAVRDTFGGTLGGKPSMDMTTSPLAPNIPEAAPGTGVEPMAPTQTRESAEALRNLRGTAEGLGLPLQPGFGPMRPEAPLISPEAQAQSERSAAALRGLKEASTGLSLTSGEPAGSTQDVSAVAPTTTQRAAGNLRQVRETAERRRQREENLRPIMLPSEQAQASGERESDQYAFERAEQPPLEFTERQGSQEGPQGPRGPQQAPEAPQAPTTTRTRRKREPKPFDITEEEARRRFEEAQRSRGSQQTQPSSTEAQERPSERYGPRAPGRPGPQPTTGVEGQRINRTLKAGANGRPVNPLAARTEPAGPSTPQRPGPQPVGMEGRQVGRGPQPLGRQGSPLRRQPTTPPPTRPTRRSEARPVPNPTPQNIDQMRARIDELSRLLDDRRGEMDPDLRDELGQLRARVINFDQQAEPGLKRMEFARAEGMRERQTPEFMEKGRQRFEEMEGRQIEEETRRPYSVEPPLDRESPTEPIDRPGLRGVYEEQARNLQNLSGEQLDKLISDLDKTRNEGVKGEGGIDADEEAAARELSMAANEERKARVARKEMKAKAAPEQIAYKMSAKVLNEDLTKLDDDTLRKRIRDIEAIKEGTKGDREYQDSSVARRRRKYEQRVRDEIGRRGLSTEITRRPPTAIERRGSTAIEKRGPSAIARIEQTRPETTTPEAPTAAEAANEETTGRVIEHSTLGQVEELKNQRGVPRGYLRVRQRPNLKTSVIKNPRVSGNRNAAFIKSEAKPEKTEGVTIGSFLGAEMRPAMADTARRVLKREQEKGRPAFTIGDQLYTTSALYQIEPNGELRKVHDLAPTVVGKNIERYDILDSDSASRNDAAMALGEEIKRERAKEKAEKEARETKERAEQAERERKAAEERQQGKEFYEDIDTKARKEMKGKRESVELSSDPDKPMVRIVTVYGEFGIHREAEGVWTISHMPTKARIAQFESQQLARRAVYRLKTETKGWNFTDPKKLPKELSQQVPPILKSVKFEVPPETAPKIVRSIDEVEPIGEEQAPAPKKTRQARQPKPTAEAKPTGPKGPQAKGPKAPKAEKQDPRTGLTETQSNYVLDKLRSIMPKLRERNPNAPDKPISIKVPGDGEFKVSTPEQANNLNRRITGENLEGYTLKSQFEGVKRAQEVKPSMTGKPRTYKGEEAKEAALRLYGSSEKAVETLKEQLRVQGEDMDPAQRKITEDTIRELEDQAKRTAEGKAEAEMRAPALIKQFKTAKAIDEEIGHIQARAENAKTAYSYAFQSEASRIEERMRLQKDIAALRRAKEILEENEAKTAEPMKAEPEKPKAEQPTPEPGDTVRWMAAGREAVADVIRVVRGDKVGVEYFGYKLIPIADLTNVQKSYANIKRAEREKAEAEEKARAEEMKAVWERVRETQWTTATKRTPALDKQVREQIAKAEKVVKNAKTETAKSKAQTKYDILRRDVEKYLKLPSAPAEKAAEPEAKPTRAKRVPKQATEEKPMIPVGSPESLQAGDLKAGDAVEWNEGRMTVKGTVQGGRGDKVVVRDDAGQEYPIDRSRLRRPGEAPTQQKPDFVKEAEDRLKNGRGDVMGAGGPSAQEVVDMAVVSGWKLYREGIKFRDWARSVISEIGQRVRPYLQATWKRLQDALNLATPEERAERLQKTVEQNRKAHEVGNDESPYRSQLKRQPGQEIDIDKGRMPEPLRRGWINREKRDQATARREMMAEQNRPVREAATKEDEQRTRLKGYAAEGEAGSDISRIPPSLRKGFLKQQERARGAERAEALKQNQATRATNEDAAYIAPPNKSADVSRMPESLKRGWVNRARRDTVAANVAQTIEQNRETRQKTAKEEGIGSRLIGYAAEGEAGSDVSRIPPNLRKGFMTQQRKTRALEREEALERNRAAREKGADQPGRTKVAGYAAEGEAAHVVPKNMPANLRKGWIERAKREAMAEWDTTAEPPEQPTASSVRTVGEASQTPEAAAEEMYKNRPRWDIPRATKAPTNVQEVRKLISDARTEYHPETEGDQGVLWVNHQASVVVASALRQINRPINISDHQFYGLSVNLQDAQAAADFLSKAGRDPQLIEIGNDLAYAVDQAFNAGRDSVVIADSTVAPKTVGQTVTEEFFHGWQRGSSLMTQQAVDEVHYRFENNPTYKNIAGQLAERGYTNNAATMSVEVPAKLASGQAENFGISDDEAYDFLHSYYSFIYRKFGTGALLGDVTATEPGRRALEDVREIAGVGRPTRLDESTANRPLNTGARERAGTGPPSAASVDRGTQGRGTGGGQTPNAGAGRSEQAGIDYGKFFGNVGGANVGRTATGASQTGKAGQSAPTQTTAATAKGAKGKTVKPPQTAAEYFQRQLDADPFNEKTAPRNRQVLQDARAELKRAADRFEKGKLTDEHKEAIIAAADDLMVSAHLGDREEIAKARKELAKAVRGGSVLRNAAYYAGQPFRAIRAIVYGSDLSYAFRQAFPLTVYPKNWGDMLHGGREMFRALVSANKTEQIKDWMRNHPAFDLAEKAGLEFAMFGKKEEIFDSDVATKIPLFGKIMERTEAANEAYLDYMRLTSFAKMVKGVQDNPNLSAKQQADQMTAMAEVVNTLTGRTSLGEGRVRSAIEGLHGVMTAPRLNYSRIQMLNPAKYYELHQKSPAAARQMAYQTGFAVSSMAALGLLAAAAGVGTFSTDPDDTDFGKLVIGNTRYDLFGGLLPVAKVFWDLGEVPVNLLRTAITNDKTTQRELSESRQSLGKRMESFTRGRLTPGAAFTYDLFYKGKNMAGQPVTPAELAKLSFNNPGLKLFTPALLNELVDGYRDTGLKGLVKSSPSFVGIGASTYNPEERAGYLDTKSPFMKQAAELGVRFKMVKRNKDDSDQTHKVRTDRIQRWLEQYGPRLLNNSGFERLDAEDKREALENLRERIGSQAKFRAPETDSFDAEAIVESLRAGKQRKKEKRGDTIYPPLGQ